MSDGRQVVLALGLVLIVSGCQPSVAPSEAAPVSRQAPSSALPQAVGTGAPVDAPAVPASPRAGDVAASDWCRLTGAAGELLRCPIGLVLQGASQSVAGLQLSFSWDAARLALVGVESRVCPPGALAASCATVMSPPLKSVGSAGHALATRPVDVSTAAGAATVMLYHPSNPNALLAAEVGSVAFRALVDVVSTAVSVSDAVATSPQAHSLAVKAAKGRLHIGSSE